MSYTRSVWRGLPDQGGLYIVNVGRIVREEFYYAPPQ